MKRTRGPSRPGPSFKGTLGSYENEKDTSPACTRRTVFVNITEGVAEFLLIPQRLKRAKLTVIGELQNTEHVGTVVIGIDRIVNSRLNYNF